MTTTTRRLASEKQLAYLFSLVAERAGAKAYVDTQLAAAHIEHPRELSSFEMSNVINVVRDMPRTSPGPAPAQATPGYYKHGDDFVCVVQTRDKARTYAKRLVVENGRASWEYAPGVGRTLAGLEPLPLDEAKAFGHLHGICMVCCKQLTDPKSVEAGIGPVCAKRF